MSLAYDSIRAAGYQTVTCGESVSVCSGQGKHVLNISSCLECHKTEHLTADGGFRRAYEHGHLRLWFPQNPDLERWRVYGDSWKVARQVRRLRGWRFTKTFLPKCDGCGKKVLWRGRCAQCLPKPEGA